jgi:alanyl-tRNA synthetase
VTATVDWPRRFDHMQQHTGQHLLSAVLADAGRETVSVHFGDTTSTLDVTGEEPLDIPAAERRANTLIAENRVIGVTFEDALAAHGLRKRPDRTGMIRIVTIEGVDRSACGGTHVARTGEIGVVLVRRAERTRGRTRVEFVCGLRAVTRARADLAALSTIAAGFSTGLDEAPAVVAEARAELASLRREAEQLAGALAKRDAHERYAAVQPDGRGRRLIVERRRDGGVDALRQLGLAVAALDGAVFLGASEDPPAVLLASSPSSGLDAGATLKGALSALGGRGGGSPRLAQGSLPSADLVPSIIDIIAKAP